MAHSRLKTNNHKSTAAYPCYIHCMKHFSFWLILAFISATAGATTSNATWLGADSTATLNQTHDGHYPSKFNAAHLESATTAKYLGSGISLAGAIMASQGERAGAIVGIAGGIISLIGVIRQDIQLVRLGRKHRQPKAGANSASNSAKPSYNFDSRKGKSCSDFNMGDLVAFQSSDGSAIEGEIIGILSNPKGCQIIVTYTLGDESRTSTLAPESLIKL